MSAPIKIAVFGVGRWGTHLLRNFLAHPQVEVVAIADPVSECLTAAAKRFNLNDHILLTTDWQVAMASPGLEAVAIATPAATHYPLILTALKQGCHVLAEKPLTLEVTEALELCQIAQQQQRQLVVDHTYLFHPVVAQGQEVLKSGKLGDLRYGYAARTNLGPVRQDVDALWDLAIHDICIFNTWLGQFPCQVEAKGTVWLQPNVATALSDSSHSTIASGLSDLVWVILTYPSGFQAVVHLCWANPDKQRRLCVVGSQATLVFDELQTAAPLTLQWGEFQRHDRQFSPINQQQEVIPFQPTEPLQQTCAHFLNCVQTNTPSSISSGWLGAQLVQVLRALTESLQQGGQPVKVQL
jgi:predicted dehydrogenase